jgi:hypothetical protein
MELTKKYFDEQLKSLATKSDVSEIQSDISAINQRIDALPTNNDLEKFATKDALNNLKTFIETNMVLKDEFDGRLDELPTRADFSKLQQTVDGIAKGFQEQRQEQIVSASRSERMEAWIMKAASKIGVEYKP